MDRRQFMKAAGVGAAGGAIALVPLAGSASASPQQLNCPVQAHYTTNAETQEGAAARLLEHMLENHVGNPDPAVLETVKSVTFKFR